MKIDFREDKSTFTYVLTECEEYKDILESQFFTYENQEYIKSYSKDEISETEVIKRNYLNYAEEMYLQMGYKKEVKWKEGLLKFIEIIENEGIEWCLIGSCALAIRGINTIPHDVDIMLSSKDIDRIREIFASYVVEPIVSSGGWVVDYFGVLFLETRIDIAFDPQEFVDDPEPSDYGPYAMANLEEVTWMGKTIKVPPLELQLSSNKSRGRNDRVEAIELFLNTIV